MGNNPSSTKQGHDTSSSNSPSQQREGAGHGQSESPRSVRRDRNPIALHNHGAAAPPEASLGWATGTIPNSQSSSHSYSSRLKSIHASSSRPGSSSLAEPTAATTPTPAKPVEIPLKSSQAVAAAAAAGPIRPPEPEPAKPVDVPISNSQKASSYRPQYPHHLHATDLGSSIRDMSFLRSGSNSVQDMSYLTRPPRLPLPIEEEVHTPGSPIISPADIGEPLEDIGNDLDVDADADAERSAGSIARRGSTVSTATVDDDDDADDGQELRVDKTRPTVPTRLEWLRGGDKVYVTGTIFQWNRKTRLHPVEGRPGVFAATINILPGTHHIRFLVDGQTITSPDLPTTVDFGNNLVNYIEVNPDDAVAADPATGTTASVAAAAAAAQPAAAAQNVQQAPKDRDVVPASAFSRHIPQYLVDFDQPEETPEYQMAWAATERLPAPPSLPGFLTKPLLNAATLIKDDNSVLNMPNHTVLNHLLTCSIRDNVLAVSATTRYKSKYVTTIIYKPTPTKPEAAS